MILQLLGLFICSIRMILLCLFFISSFTDLYPYYSDDFSHIPRSSYAPAIAGTTMSLCLVISTELMLMSQAWTMVKLWPNFWKYIIAGSSLVVSLMTISIRIAFTVLQNKSNLAVETTWHWLWLSQWTVIMNVVSIAWWCLVFNIKLVWHLISNRGILPSYKTFTPMEVLIMTNGILMIIPGSYPSLSLSSSRE
jgi:pheromone alpha factor receptor